MPIVPADVDQTVVFRKIYVGGAGNLKVDFENGGTATYTGLPVGAWIEANIKRVWATGSTATLLVGMY
jgi:hypothetical protein